jgi:protein required for attachment to host cells
MKTRIVVCDQSEARIYELERLDGPMNLIGRLTDPAARLHDRDLKSDRPGRVFDRASAGGKRRGATAHHSTGGERTPRKHASQLFARRIAAELETAHRQKQYQRLILVCGPAFLGLLRAELPATTAAALVAEVPKDLVHESEKSLRAHLPRPE